MPLNLEGLKKIAQALNLDLSDLEASNYQTQLSALILEIEALENIGFSNPILESDISNQFREDEVQAWPSDEVELALSQSPEQEDGQIKVNRVM
ncbi:MAG: Asp-tRNA(Asn)/Glu-tRNA(Gln) amidotransferase subunit GatC [Patescibacteria group bacterium]|jgi:aspartyl/glutamyl-tRNA(Asn/Gln) amidotransferase C subunit